MVPFPDIFTELAVLLLAAAVGVLDVRLHQPLIVAFIAVGILAGPSVLGRVSANDQVDLLPKPGITLVGLITISASTCMILYSHPLYERMAPWLKPFERRRRGPATPGTWLPGVERRLQPGTGPRGRCHGPACHLRGCRGSRVHRDPAAGPYPVGREHRA